MSAITTIKGFSSYCLFLICFWIVLIQVILRMEIGILEKIFFLLIVFTLQLTLIVFETWRLETFEEEPQGQIWPFVPGHYGFDLMGGIL